MAKFVVEFLPSPQFPQASDAIPAQTIVADRFCVYAQDRIAFFVDHKTPGFFGERIDSEVTYEIKTTSDFIVRKEN